MELICCIQQNHFVFPSHHDTSETDFVHSSHAKRKLAKCSAKNVVYFAVSKTKSY